MPAKKPAKRNSRMTFVDLEKKVDQPDPFEVEVAPDVWLTFQDPYAGDYDVDLDMPDKPADQMRKLLGDEAYEAFQKTDTKLSGRAYAAIAAAVMEHFRLGEDVAS